MSRYDFSNIDHFEFIHQVKDAHGLQKISDVVHSLSQLNILVIGEPIIDTYVFCEASGISSKSPTVSAQLIRQENYAGGSLGIANQLAALGCQVTLLISHGDEVEFRQILKNSLHPQINLKDFVTDGIATPQKTRYLDAYLNQRIFELINVRSDQWEHLNPDPFCHLIFDHLENQDLVIVSDFGHGLFEGKVLQSLEEIHKPLSLNVQTNSGNYGFNVFTKHKKFDYLCIDERECRLAVHDRLTPIQELANEAVRNLIQKPTSVTLGSNGSFYYDDQGTCYRSPSFFKRIFDSTGSGDAYLAMTSALKVLKTESLLIPFLGNCFAGLAAQIIGNKKPVSKDELIHFLEAVMA